MTWPRDFQVLYLTTSDRYDSVADSVLELPGPTLRDEFVEVPAEPAAVDVTWAEAAAVETATAELVLSALEPPEAVEPAAEPPAASR